MELAGLLEVVGGARGGASGFVRGIVGVELAGLLGVEVVGVSRGGASELVRGRGSGSVKEWR